MSKLNYNIDNYQAEGACNRNNNPFIKSEYTNFQAWKNDIIDKLPIKYVQYRGMFVVSKQNILYVNKIFVKYNTAKNIDFIKRVRGHFPPK